MARGTGLESPPAARFRQATIEAANRAEATALLIRCGYRVYRPEADIAGEDLVVRPSGGALMGVQLKSRPTVDRQRYGGLDLWMLFPGGPFKPGGPRPRFLVPHDPLLVWVEARHGQNAKWDGYWHAPRPSQALHAYLAEYEIKPPSGHSGRSAVAD